MRRSFSWVLVFFIVMSGCQPALAVSAKPMVEVYLRDDVYADYEAFLAGRDVLSINDFSGKTVRRDVVDMILAQQALALGGFNYRFRFTLGPINFRNTKKLEQGELLISFDSYWLADAEAIAKQVYISAPLLAKGDYLAGIYASPTNFPVFTITQREDIQQFTAVSTPRWRSDWQTLLKLHPKKLISEHEWVSQARMVHMHWVDFMLMPLMPNQNNEYHLDSIHLKAVPGLAVALLDSRHYVVSRQHPLGAKAFAALEKGLAILQAQGKVKQAYQQAGFYPTLPLTIINQADLQSP